MDWWSMCSAGGRGRNANDGNGFGESNTGRVGEIGSGLGHIEGLGAQLEKQKLLPNFVHYATVQCWMTLPLKMEVLWLTLFGFLECLLF